MPSRTLDPALDDLVRDQRGVFSRRQAVALGATPSMIKSRLRSGRWIRLDNAVYALRAHPSDWHQRVLAATLGEPTAVASGHTAAVLHGFERFRQGRVMITVPPRSDHVSQLAKVRRSALIEPTMVDGIPANSAALTLFEVAGQVPATITEQALESGLRSGTLTMDDLIRWYERLEHSRRRGLPVMRALLDARSTTYTPSASELERLLYAAFDIPEFAPLERQARFPWSPDSPQQVDALLPIDRIILEADGRNWHTQRSAMARDRQRDRSALAHGYVTARFVWEELRDGPGPARDAVRAIRRARRQPATQAA